MHQPASSTLLWPQSRNAPTHQSDNPRLSYGDFAISLAPEAFKSEGAQIPALCPSPTFSWCPMTGHYRKVQGTVTRTELGQRWSTVRGQSDLWLFKVTHCQRWPRQSIELTAWMVSYRSPVDTNSVSCSVSEMLHLNPETYFSQFRGTSAHTLASGSRAPEGNWTPA